MRSRPRTEEIPFWLIVFVDGARSEITLLLQRSSEHGLCRAQVVILRELLDAVLCRPVANRLLLQDREGVANGASVFSASLRPPVRGG